MININLVPQHLRKKKSVLFEDDRIAIPKEVLIGTAGAIVAVLLIVHLVLGVITLMRVGELKMVSGKWEQMADDKKVVDQVLSDLNNMRAKLQTLKPLVKSNISWSVKLNQISDAIPSGVWLRELTITEEQLQIEGSAVSKSQGEIISVGNFVSALKDMPDFMQNFSQINVSRIKRRSLGSVSVADFSIEATMEQTE